MPSVETLLDRVDSAAALERFEPSTSWVAIEIPIERGLEGWIEAIARADLHSGVAAALSAAELALPIVSAADAAETSLDFGGPDTGFGWDASPRQQVAAVRSWVDAPTEDATVAVNRAAEYARQLNVWDDDLRPLPEHPSPSWYTYFVEAANLLTFAVLHDSSGGPYGPASSVRDRELAERWPNHVCAARAAVCAYKSMRSVRTDRVQDLEAIISVVKRTLAG